MSTVLDTESPDLTFGQVLDRTVKRHGDRPALVFPQLSYRRSYVDFQQEVHRAAHGLLALGIEPGEHVGLWATNWPQWVVLQFAVAKIGAVLVNVNPAYRAQELKYVLNQADITTLFLTEQIKSTDCFAIVEAICPEIKDGKPELRSASCPRLRHLVNLQSTKHGCAITWDDLCEQGGSISEEALFARQSAVVPEDVVNIQYTSGTTGYPKGAMLSHRNLILNAWYVGDRQAFQASDRLCIPVPFYHCFGCVMGTLMCVLYGSAMVIPSEVFDPLATLRAIQDEKCTAVYGVPTMFIAELSDSRFGEHELSSLRTGIMAGSPCPIDVMKAVEERMGAKEITIAYGLTEASPVITQTRTTDDREHRVETVGLPLPGVEVKIVQPGTEEPVERGQSGELMARGHGIMKGYYNKPEATAEAITPDGWLHSGDLAIENEDGYYQIIGRIKDVIIRGGENIYPKEIEDYLRSHSGVADAQVVGLPDARFGEAVSAWIRPEPGQELTEQEVQEYCRGQIAHYKIPHYVIFVEEYPTTVTGKIQKFRLREMGIEKFGLQKEAGIRTA